MRLMALMNSLEDRLFQLFLKDESLFEMSTDIISEDFCKRLDEYRKSEVLQQCQE